MEYSHFGLTVMTADSTDTFARIGSHKCVPDGGLGRESSFVWVRPPHI